MKTAQHKEDSPLTLDQFIDSIGRGWSKIEKSSRHSGPDRILNQVTSPEGFVNPTLEIIENADEHVRVQLVSAPAAVGKSWLAQAIADRTENPLWDLSRFQLGSNFFSGTLVKYYGENFSKADQALREGNGAFIIDALDEALVRAGLRNTLEAIGDLADLLRDISSSHSSVVLFGRPEAIEIAGAALISAGISVRHVEVSFFSEDMAYKYLRTKANIFARESGRTLSPAVLDQFIEFISNGLAKAVGDLDNSFVGYAPVLDALAMLADQPNLFASLKNYEGSGHQFAWPFLAATINEILKRESNKFASSFSGSGSADRALAKDVYSPEFQLRSLLLSDLEEIDVNTHDYDNFEWRPALRKALQAQIREHPFLTGSGRGVNPWSDILSRLRNSVFRDYLAAWAFCEGVPECRNVAMSYSRPELPPSPILLQMIMQLSDSGGMLDGEVIGPLLDSSAAAQGFRDTETHVFVDSSNDSGLVEIHIVESDGSEWEGSAVLENGGQIWLSRWAVNCVLDVPEFTVVIGAGKNDFAFGGDVSIRCSRLESLATSVRIAVDSKVVLLSDEVGGVTEEMSLSKTAEISVYAPSVGYPWVLYRAQVDSSQRWSEETLIKAALELRGLSVWYMAPSIMKGYRYPSSSMDNLVAKGRVSGKLFEYLEAAGFLTKDHGDYVIMVPAWLESIRNCDIQDENLRKFLTDYLDWRGPIS